MYREDGSSSVRLVRGVGARDQSRPAKGRGGCSIISCHGDKRIRKRERE